MDKTKRGRGQHRQRPRFCTIRYDRLGILDLIRIRLGGLIACLWCGLARFVKCRLHGLVAPRELANGKFIGLVVGQAQVLGATAQIVLGLLELLNGGIDFLDRRFELLARQVVVAREAILELLHLGFEVRDVNVLLLVLR